jgi:hypothetical protein
MKTRASTLAAFLLPSILTAQIRFVEVAAASGVKFKLNNAATGNYHQIELMPGGVAVLDYNNDGCMDVFFTNGASQPGLKKSSAEFSNRLFRNNCNMTFTDVTEKVGVAGEGYSMGVAAGDFDNDGFPDIYVTGVNRNILYHNRGDGTFEDVTTKAGLGGIDKRFGKMWSLAAGWFDYDNDGYLDLFVTSYVAWDPAREPVCGSPAQRLYCHPSTYAGRPHQLFHNNGDGTFTDVSVSSGIASSIGKGMGLAFADFNGDGLMDVFVANDSVRNFLFQNQGKGRFKEVGLLAGVAYPEDGRAVASMGADFRDFDNDGRPDLIVTAMVNDTYPLFRSTGAAPSFEDWTVRSGLSLLTRRLTGWSVGLYDFDNDGWKDLFFANAHFPALSQYLGAPSPLRNSILRNLGTSRFEDVSGSAGPAFEVASQHRGAAFADFDGDGRVDIVVSAIDAPARLLHNVTPNAGHWLAVKLVGVKSNRDGLGARVEIGLADGKRLYNHATTSVGYASSSEPLVRFGLGAHASVKTLRVRWPSGCTGEIENVKADRVVTIQEGAARIASQ